MQDLSISQLPQLSTKYTAWFWCCILDTPFLWQHGSSPWTTSSCKMPAQSLQTVPINPAGRVLGAQIQYQSFKRGDCINSWCTQTGGAAGKERGRDRGRGNLKCWTPAVNSSCFCFRVINVPLNRARAWAPVSGAFNAISSLGWAGRGGGRFGFPAIPSK